MGASQANRQAAAADYAHMDDIAAAQLLAFVLDPREAMLLDQLDAGARRILRAVEQVEPAFRGMAPRFLPWLQELTRCAVVHVEQVYQLKAHDARQENPLHQTRALSAAVEKSETAQR